MRRAKQIDFFESQRDYAPRRHKHGGSETKGKRKLRRPLDPKKPLHLVLKASAARGPLSMLSGRNRLAVERIITKYAKKSFVTVHHKENMGNHLHLVVTFAKREGFQDFLRTVTALISRHVTKARRGKPFGKPFWDHLAFTRVIQGYRDQMTVKNYLWKNEIERNYGSSTRMELEEFENEVANTRRTASRKKQGTIAKQVVVPMARRLEGSKNRRPEGPTTR